MQPIKLEIFLDDKTLAGMKSVEGNIAAMETVTRQVIENLKLQLKDLEKQYKILQGQGLAGDREMADIQAMQGAIGGLKDRLKELQKAKQQTNETPIIDEQAVIRQTNSLKMQFSQVARELPALAMGPQMFILAISNNLPYLADAIKDVRVQNEALSKSGQKATPVWKQLLSAAGSWQTMLVIGITLLTVYGKEIGNFFSSLFSGKKTITGLADAQEELNKTMMSSDTGVGKNLVSLKMLQEKWSALGNDLATKKKFIRENKDEFDKLNVAVTNVSDAENLLVGNTEAFIESMKLRAKGAAAQKMAAEKYEESLKLQLEIEKEKKRPVSSLEKTVGSMNTVQSRGLIVQTGEDIHQAGITYLENKKKAVDDAANAFFQLGVEAENEAQKELKAANIKERIKVKTPVKGGKTITDYENELSDARVRAQQKTEEAYLAVMTDGYLKRKELAGKEYKETLADIDKRERDDLKRIAAARKKGVKVGPEEENQVKSNAQLQRGLAHQKFYKDYAAIEVDWLSQGTKAWIEYNKQYGTSQQKRLAIAQEYGIKIAQAENPIDKERYKKEMEETLSSFDFDKLKKSMNWELIFGNLGALTRRQLQDVKQQLTAFRNSPEFKQTASPEQIKIIEDALNNINATMVDKSGFFGGLGDALTDYEAKVKAVAAAQEELNKALEAGDEAAIEKAKQNLNQANANKQGSQGNVDKSTDKAVGNLNKVAAAMKQLSSADVSLSEVGGAVENLVSILGESKSKIGGIIAAILSILDTIGDKGITDFVTDLVSNVMSSLRDAAIKDIDKTSFGLIDMSFFKGADYSDYNEMIDQYTRMNEIWDELIDKKKEYIKTSYGEEAEKAGKEAEDLVRKSMDSYRTLGLERLNAGASTGSHSIGVRQRKGMSKEGWNEARNVLGGDFDRYEIGDGRMTGLFSLSVEQLEKLKYEAPTFWAKLDGDVADYLNKIIEGSEKIAEIQEQVKEQLTQVSFDNVRSSFLDTLMDMDSSAEDFADNFSEYMQRAILDSMMAKSYEDRLQAWYDSFADANSKNEGGKTNISDDEYNKLQEEWDNIVSDALGERDALKDLFGWKGEEGSSQTGRGGAYTAMSQEQGTKLEGTFNAMLDRIIAVNQLMADLMKGREADHEIFLQIAENTAYCKYLEQIYELWEEMKRDGMKLKG